MKFIGKILLSLLLVLVLFIVLIYVLLQTSWGAGWIGKLVTRHSNYQLSLGKIDHSWSKLSELAFDNIAFGQKERTPTLVAKRLVAGFSSRQLTDPYHFERIRLQDGTLNLDPASLAFPLQADVLQLNGMAVQSPHGEWHLNGQNVSAGITPWKPENGFPLGLSARFELSARSLTLNGMPAENVLVRGNINNQQLTLDDLGADLSQGQLTGNARREQDGSWQVDNLRLSNVRMQTELSLEQFLKQVSRVPKITIHRFDLIDARMEGKSWAFSDLDLSLRDITFQQGDWSSEDGNLSFNASELVSGPIHLSDPIASMNFSPAGITIGQFSGRWEGGLMRTAGQWLRDGKRLVLDDFMMAGLEYTLPADWRQSWQKPLPAWLAEVAVTKLTASRNLLIDITPSFPFQVTALDVSARQLELVRDHRWGIWSGNLNLNGSDATFNKIDIRRPSLALKADEGKIAISEASAFAGSGLVELSGSVSQQPERAFTLRLSGRSVPVNLMENWGWPALPLAGNGNLQLNLSGSLAGSKSFKESINGQLRALDTSGNSIYQTMVNGDISASDAP